MFLGYKQGYKAIVVLKLQFGGFKIRTSDIEIDGKKYKKPTKNLFGLAALEYLIWFSIPIILTVVLVLSGTVNIYRDEETGEYDDTSMSASMITGLAILFCWFIVGPVSAYFSVITIPLLMRSKNVIKWNEHQEQKVSGYVAKMSIYVCSNCKKEIPIDANICPYCSEKIDKDAQERALNEQKKIIGGTVKIVQKQKAKKHIGSGIFWFFWVLL